VTLGVLLRKGISVTEAAYYWAAQVVGAIVGAALLKLLVSSFGGATDKTGGLGTNDWGTNITAGGTFVLEIVMTFLLVLVVLLVTNRAAAPGFAGLAIGLVLTVIHLVGIPLDGTSVNPSRSLGPALFNGGESLAHVWMFIIAPLIGGALAPPRGPLLRDGHRPQREGPDRSRRPRLILDARSTVPQRPRGPGARSRMPHPAARQ
jgi:aquaporin Z